LIVDGDAVSVVAFYKDFRGKPNVINDKCH
jgi:hypothetical protein